MRSKVGCQLLLLQNTSYETTTLSFVTWATLQMLSHLNTKVMFYFGLLRKDKKNFVE